MNARSWVWLRRLVLSLLDRPARFLAFQDGEFNKIAQIPSTRLGYQLNPPVLFGDD